MNTLFLILLLLAPLQKSNIDQAYFLFQKGNELYEKGQYSEAIQQYEAALQHRQASGTLYFNLGNAYYKLGKTGKAILNYERARLYLPNDEDVEFNLSLANLAVVDKIVVPPQFIVFKWLDDIRYFLSLPSLTWAVLISYFSFVLIIIIRILNRQDKFSSILKIATIALATVLIIFTLVFVGRLREKATKVPAIVLTEKLSVRSGPETSETEVFALHEGVKVFILETSGEWSKIRLADGKIGWLPKNNLEVI